MVLSAKRITEIADEEVDRILEKEKYMVDTLYGEGGFIGDIVLPGAERLDAYWATVTNPDGSLNEPTIVMIMSPGTEDRIKLNEEPLVQFLMPYWKNLLREPGLFTSTAADFVRLNKQHEDRYQEATNATVRPDRGQPAPVTPSGGPPGYG